MKILHIIPSIAQVRGGTSRAILDMVKALKVSGIDAEIVTTNDNGKDLLVVPLGQRHQYEQVPIYFFPRFSPHIYSLREFAFSAQLTTWLWHNIHKYDLLHVHALFSYVSTVAMTIARIKKIPYLNIPHGLLCEWSLQQSARKKQIYLDIIERANLNHSQALHLTSWQEQQEVNQLNLTAPSIVLPHGLSIPETIPNAGEKLRQQFNLPPDEIIILFLSRLHQKKGLDYLIRALSQLNNHHFTFILAGSGEPEYEQEIETLLIKTGLRSHTQIVGFVEGENKDLLLQGSDLFVLTSHSENFGVAVLEALSVGLPVLVTPGVALASVVKQHQLGYVTKLDVNAIASSLTHCLTHPQEAKAMGNSARQFILENYTWDKIAANLIKVYQSIVNRDSHLFLAEENQKQSC